MQRIVGFELDMAMKDRPRFFRFITLSLFSFSIAIILISSFTQLSKKEVTKHGYANGTIATSGNDLSSVKQVMFYKK